MKCIVVVALMCAIGCASESAGSMMVGSGGSGGKGDMPGDGGSGSGAFGEAMHVPQPTVSSAGGPILAAPRVVPIFFHGDDAMQVQIESFLPQLAASSYWPQIAAEYGVGALTATASIVSTDMPPTTDAALQMWIASHVGVDWPASDANTIYTVFLPAGVTFTTSFGTSCSDYGGFHEETPDGTLVYALMPDCDGTIDTMSRALSHELLEGSTDPHPYTAPAYNVVDNDNQLWEYLPGSELGDMCFYAPGSFQRLVGSFLVQRMWSNASAAAGHDPCVPALAQPYAEAVANASDALAATPRSVQVAVGMSTVVEIDLYSDAPTSDWTVQAFDVASMSPTLPPELTLALDNASGQNGDKRMLTITRMNPGMVLSNASVVELVSGGAGVSGGVWWVVVL